MNGISSLTNLKHVNVIRIPDHNMKYFTKQFFMLFEVFKLSYEHVKDAFLKIISENLKHLTELQIHSYCLTDSGLAYISCLDNFQKLVISYNNKWKWTQEFSSP